MFYIVESEKQLQRLRDLSCLEKCYVEVITKNDNFHPALTSPVAVYIRPLEKHIDPESGKEVGWKNGYIIPIDHNEGLCVSLDTVSEILQLYRYVYVLDRKYTLYYLNHPNFWDMNLIYCMTKYEKLEYFVREKTYNWFYNRYGGRKDLNQIIPISKIYEKCENTFEQVQEVLDMDLPSGFKYYNEVLTNIYYLIEKEGIRVDVHEFVERFKPTNPDFSISGETVYTRYNLYNTTGRPTNSFNGVNFLAIPKGQEFRRCFKPKNTQFVQLDFDGYHVRLVSDMIGFEIPCDIKAHKYLARQYFGKNDISDAEYKEAKQMNFQAIYGAVPDEYKHTEFFSKLLAFIDKTWEEFCTKGTVKDRCSQKEFTTKLPEMRASKLMNYLVQSAETSRNVWVLYKLLKFLRKYKTKVLLITYDSVLLDWSDEDPVTIVWEISQILTEEKFPVSVDYSKDLNFS